ncbi:transglycosylase [Saccharomonospora sp. CUA-673]|uniref:resuscitation-promoting factor n=1 Tax=Saccharomonospora sp. CUA-673 TaxID=1904969 RepID=UPI00095C5F35|nr:resuscitation-promoting factor [Saccharomonospora sp. CUA-673]OLT49287.1 transglycosylase [Saccharomonospora sp. CUA-673]
MLDRPSDPEFSSDPRITRDDILAVLGPDADAMMAEANVGVDELIRLMNAETTMLPPIVDTAPAPGAVAAADADDLDADDGFASAVRTWKKRFLKGSVLAMLITLTGGGAAALAMNKSVTLDVDGEQQTIRSYGETVGEILDDADINVGKHDALSPSPQASVGDGGVIKLERGRHLTVTVDGEEQTSWVRATTVGEALTQLDLDHLKNQGAEFSAPLDGDVPLKGKNLEIKTLKNVTVYDGGDEPREVQTNAVTAEELLDELGLELGPRDEVKSGRDMKLTDNAEVFVARTGVSVVNEKEAIEPEVREIEDPELEQGKEIVEDEGKAGEKLVTYRVTKENGEEISRKEVDSKVLKEAEDRVVRVGTKEPPQPQIADGAVWDQLAECESGGDWSISTGNGYYGGLQFDKQTWDAYGGSQYAAYPHEASREQQIATATQVRDDRGGYSAWPACSSKLGLS